MTYPQQAPMGSYPAPPQPARPPLPAINGGWAVAAIVFFWPVAFAAVNYSLSVYPRWAAGDFAGAQHASERAKKLGKIALTVFAAILILYVVFVGVAIAAGISEASSSSSGY